MSASKTRAWRYGLVSAAIGGGASSIHTAIAMLVAAPKELNFNEHLGKTLVTILAIGIVNAVMFAAAFLKQSPLPPLEGKEESTT